MDNVITFPKLFCNIKKVESYLMFFNYKLSYKDCKYEPQTISFLP